MKRYLLIICTLFFLITSSYSDTIPVDKTVGIYIPYTFKLQSNNIKSSGSYYDISGKNHSLQLTGFGIKYFPHNKIFFDFSNKTLLNVPEIGKTINITGGYSYTSIIGRLSTISLCINYCFLAQNNMDIYSGIGIASNNIEIVSTNNSYILNNQFYTNFVRFGIEYKTTNNFSLGLNVGYETEETLKLKSLFGTNDDFVYKYDGALFLEPTITFYF